MDPATLLKTGLGAVLEYLRNEGSDRAIVRYQSLSDAAANGPSSEELWEVVRSSLEESAPPLTNVVAEKLTEALLSGQASGDPRWSKAAVKCGERVLDPIKQALRSKSHSLQGSELRDLSKDIADAIAAAEAVKSKSWLE